MRSRTPSSVRVSGPLAQYAASFVAELRGRGYTEVTACHHLHLFAQLSRWLEEGGLEPAELSSAEVARFIRARRAAAPTGPRTERALSPLLGHLRRLGVVPEPEVAAPDGPIERLLERYRAYLVRERGLVATTVAWYLVVARLFLKGRAGAAALDLSDLGAAEVTGFVLRESQRRSVGGCQAPGHRPPRVAALPVSRRGGTRARRRRAHRGGLARDGPAPCA